ncbi:MAG TPA: ABC transporter ATP-binding protein [Acidimicrobiales bacterium]
MSPPALAASGLVAGYRRGRAVVAAPDLVAHRGAMTAVVGPNGAGKSTLLRTLVGAQPPLAGEVTVDGRPLAALDRRTRARHLAVVLTDRIDAGLLTVGELVALGRHPHTGWQGRLSAGDREAARRAAAALGVADLWDEPFAELSDGQRQRVLVARALAQEPDVLVLDEPTAYLDVGGRITLAATLADLARTRELAVVVSTHDLDLAVDHAAALWLVADGRVTVGAPAGLVADGRLAAAFGLPPDALARPGRWAQPTAGPGAGPAPGPEAPGPEAASASGAGAGPGG